MTTVLLVDDEPPIRLLYRTNLEPEGYTVVEAENGPQALDLAGRTGPDVALLDILLPGMSGWSVAAELARGEQTREIALVFLSALTPSSAKLRELDRVGIPYIEKPQLDPIRLPSLIPEIIAADRKLDRDQKLSVLEQLAATP